jgi:hypothetical protein
VGKLTCNYQYQGLPGQQPALVLSYNPNGVAQPSSNHGPFHLYVISISYQNTIYFQSSAPMVAPPSAGPRGIGGVAKKKGSLPELKQKAAAMRPGIGGVAKKKGSGPTIKPSPPGGLAPAEAGKSGYGPSRDVRFYLQMWVVPEPRMVFSGNGFVTLLEAVDELGQSLTSTASDEGPTFGPRGMAVGLMQDGPIGNLAIHLRRPESAGKLIKTLRGTVEVSVSSPRPNPLVIPLEGAAGKTFQNDDRRVVVNSIDTDPARRQKVIELTIDDLDELFPAEPVDGPGFAGGRAPMRGRAMGLPFGNDLSQWPIQILTSTGQNTFFQTSIGPESGRLILRLNQMPQLGEAKEIRISSIVRATAKIPFEFHDLPMP